MGSEFGEKVAKTKTNDIVSGSWIRHRLIKE